MFLVQFLMLIFNARIFKKKKRGGPQYLMKYVCLCRRKWGGGRSPFPTPTHTNVMSCCSERPHCNMYVLLIGWYYFIFPFPLEILNLSNVYKSFSIVNLFHKLEMSSSLTSFIKHVTCTCGTQQSDICISINNINIY